MNTELLDYTIQNDEAAVVTALGSNPVYVKEQVALGRTFNYSLVSIAAPLVYHDPSVDGGQLLVDVQAADVGPARSSARKS